MFKPLARLILSPVAIAIFDILILIPMTLAIVEIVPTLGHEKVVHESIEIMTGIGVIMIGWGVVLEERAALRHIFGIDHAPNEARESELDHFCHHFGLGQLVLGLLAEICVEVVELPDRIINTSGVEMPVTIVGLLFIVVGALLLVVHVARLIGFAARK